MGKKCHRKASVYSSQSQISVAFIISSKVEELCVHMELLFVIVLNVVGTLHFL